MFGSVIQENCFSCVSGIITGVTRIFHTKAVAILHEKYGLISNESEGWGRPEKKMLDLRSAIGNIRRC